MVSYIGSGFNAPGGEMVGVSFVSSGPVVQEVSAYIFTAELGTFALAGQAAGLLTGRTIVAGVGSYSLSG